MDAGENKELAHEDKGEENNRLVNRTTGEKRTKNENDQGDGDTRVVPELANDVRAEKQGGSMKNA